MTRGSTMTQAATGLHDAEAARRAGGELLSLALLDARNLTLTWLAAFEAAGQLDSTLPSGHERPFQPQREIGHAGWFQEWWVARHVQRSRGEASDPQGPRLASIEPLADRWFGPASVGGASEHDAAPAVDAGTLRAYLAQTLEATLEMLAQAEESDAGLHVYRLALWHEDRLAESLAVAAQWLGVPPPRGALRPGPAPSRPEREPLWLPARVLQLGSARGGFVPPNERWSHAVDVPDFEIDAQAVSWARMAQFAEDGGYDDERWWSADGWRWLQHNGRRGPRAVEQWRGAVVVQRFGRLQQAPAQQAATHVSFHEAEAWCRWAGRRLPTEPEWELAATGSLTFGFAWGDVQEWVAGRSRRWPGASEIEVPGCADPWPEPPQRVLRGASSWAAPRVMHPKGRTFAVAERDDLFSGFRSCAN